MSQGIEIYTAQLDALMDCLDAQQLKAAWRTGLRPSAKDIERGVLSQLAIRHPNATKYSKEVKIKVWSQGQGYTVALSKGQMEFRRSKSGKTIEYSHLYILRWLSKGTNVRTTRKGGNRGRIVGSHFFYKGVMQTIDAACNRISKDVLKSFEQAVEKAKRVALTEKSGQPL